MCAIGSCACKAIVDKPTLPEAPQCSKLASVFRQKKEVRVYLFPFYRHFAALAVAVFTYHSVINRPVLPSRQSFQGASCLERRNSPRARAPCQHRGSKPSPA